MKKLAATCVLSLTLCISTLAGDIPGDGKAEPTPTPLPTTGSTAPEPTIGDTSALEEALIPLLLAMIRV